MDTNVVYIIYILYIYMLNYLIYNIIYILDSLTDGYWWILMDTD